MGKNKARKHNHFTLILYIYCHHFLAPSPRCRALIYYFSLLSFIQKTLEVIFEKLNSERNNKNYTKYRKRMDEMKGCVVAVIFNDIFANIVFAFHVPVL